MKALLAAALFALPIAAHAAADSPIAWTTYQDPTDRAFQLEVPAGWRVDGGVVHHSPSEIFWYVTAVSPDGNVNVAIGDPQLQSIPIHAPPSAPASPAASGTKSRAKPAARIVGPFERGAAFATRRGLQMMQSLHMCAKPVQIGIRDEPDPPHEESDRQRDVATGEAFLLCDERPYVAYVVATTTRPTLQADSWEVALLGTALAPVDRVIDATDILLHMLGSWRFDPAWAERARQLGPAAPRLLVPSAGRGDAMAAWAAAVAESHDLAWQEIQSVVRDAAQVCLPERGSLFPHRCGLHERNPRR
jgi:hypothetical protein